MQSMARIATVPAGERPLVGGALPMRLLALTAGFLVLGCTGSVDGSGSRGAGGSMSVETGGSGGSGPGGSGGSGTGGAGGSGAGGTGPMVLPPGAVSVGISPLRRLTSEQYRNTVRDLLLMKDAKDVVGTGDLPTDGSISERFSANTVGGVQGVDAIKYAEIADKLATKAVIDLQALLPCQASGGEACATQFIQSFGKRAFRRPLQQPEVARMQKVFTAGAAGGQFANGIKLVIQAFLQSPKFLYLVEPVPADAAGKILAVDNYAMATRLSYFFLNSMPDNELFRAADAGQLATAEGVAMQATRLTKDERFRETLGAFHGEWLELSVLDSADKDVMKFPVWTPALKTALAQQVRMFIEGVIQDGDGRVDTLLAGNFTWLSGPLYDLYGVTKPANLTAWTKVELDPKQRAGLFTQSGLMAGLAHEDRTSFILRGKLVREALLCDEIPPPPAGVDTSEMNIPATATAKERSEQHRRDPMCSSCHSVFDPVGFTFEGYDTVGRFRTTDATGKPLDTIGKLEGTGKPGLDGEYPDAIALMKKLGASPDVKECMTRMWLRFGLGRAEDPDDKVSLEAAYKVIKDSGKIPDMLIALARSDAFRHQKVKP